MIVIHDPNSYDSFDRYYTYDILYDIKNRWYRHNI